MTDPDEEALQANPDLLAQIHDAPERGTERPPRRMGRPPSDDPKTEAILVRVTKGEKAAIAAAASTAGVPISTWVAARAVAAAKRAR